MVEPAVTEALEEMVRLAKPPAAESDPPTARVEVIDHFVPEPVSVTFPTEPDCRATYPRALEAVPPPERAMLAVPALPTTSPCAEVMRWPAVMARLAPSNWPGSTIRSELPPRVPEVNVKVPLLMSEPAENDPPLMVSDAPG